jgi:hypothetical protein
MDWKVPNHYWLQWIHYFNNGKNIEKKIFMLPVPKKIFGAKKNKFQPLFMCVVDVDSAKESIGDVVIGMPHRGRNNFLVNICVLM